MTDDDFLEHLRAAERFIDQHPGPRGMKGACEHLDRRLRGRCQDRQQRDALYRVCSSLNDGSARILDETIDVLSRHLRSESRISLRDNEKMIRFAQAYGASPTAIRDSSGIQQAYEMMQQQILAPLTAKAMDMLTAQLNPPIMNQQTIDNAQAALDKAIADKVKADAAAAKAEQLAYLAKLANATTHLIATIQGGSTAGRSEFVTYRKELAPLAESLGYRIVFIGDRSTAALVSL